MEILLNIQIHRIIVVASSYQRSHHGCVKLHDGKILIAGGLAKKNNRIVKTDSVQVFCLILCMNNKYSFRYDEATVIQSTKYFVMICFRCMIQKQMNGVTE